MGESSSDFRDTLVELIDASPEPMDHPSPDQWIAYHRGELAAEEEARFQEHLVRCRDCFDLAAAAAEFAPPDEEPGAGQEVDTAALWRLLRPQLDPPDRSAAPERPRDLLRRAAAAVPVVSSAHGPGRLVLRGAGRPDRLEPATAERLSAPRANVPIVEVSTGERCRSGQELTMPAGPGMLVFHPAEERPVYRLVIRDAATGGELSSHELRLDQDLALTLYFPRGSARAAIVWSCRTAPAGERGSRSRRSFCA